MPWRGPRQGVDPPPPPKPLTMAADSATVNGIVGGLDSAELGKLYSVQAMEDKTALKQLSGV